VLRHLTLIAALAFVGPAAAHAQSLAELAKKNEKKKDEKSKTITADELRRAGRTGHGNVSPPGPSNSASEDTKKEGGEGEAAEGEAGEAEKSPDEQREQARADWSKGLTDAEAEVKRLEGSVADLEQSLANPGVGTVEQRAKRVADLEKAKADLAAARQKVSALEREGRQRGYRR